MGDGTLDANVSVTETGKDAPVSHRHPVWVRLTHWTFGLAVLVLIFSGVTILLAHPRLYWGHAGNDLTPALIELPIGPNRSGAQFSAATHFFAADGPATANRLAEPWNENAWARSLHFLAAWIFLFGLGGYLLLALVTGHARRNLVPGRGELTAANLRNDVRAHMRWPMPRAGTGPPYAILQKLAYALTALLALPLMILSGLAMSPAISAAYPLMLDLFGGTQSARTIHFFVFAFIAMFVLVHLAMVLFTGPLRQLSAMTVGAGK
jgi:thiosulfate reductase cytochrome b subunit